MQFEQWKACVDRVVSGLIYVKSRYINDLPYWDLWNAGFDYYEVGTYSATNFFLTSQSRYDEYTNCLLTGYSMTKMYKKIDNHLSKMRNKTRKTM